VFDPKVRLILGPQIPLN